MSTIHCGQIITQVQLDALHAELQQLRAERAATTAQHSLREELPETELYTRYLPGVTPENADLVNADKDGWNRYRAAALLVFARVCEERDSHQRVAIKTMEQLEILRRAFMRFHHVVTECEQLASRYCGSIDGVEEHGGDDHEDPTCAIWHRLYYAEYDARRALAALAASVKP